MPLRMVVPCLLLGQQLAAASLLPQTCSAPGWRVHSNFDALCDRKTAKKQTTQTCGACIAVAKEGNRSVFSWNEESHHCYTETCSTFNGAPNSHVISGCLLGVAGCAQTPAPPPGPPPPPPHPPGPPPGPAQFVEVPAGHFTMGRPCADCDGMRMDDPKMDMKPGYLSYDEQPPHPVSLPALHIMKQTISQADFALSGLPGTADDVSHEVACSFARWYTVHQSDGAVYRLPTEAEWEFLRGGNSSSSSSSSSSSVLEFGPREHIFDWHGVYPDPPLPPAATVAGPSTGILKVIRDGTSASATTRYSQSIDASFRSAGTPPATFRLVKMAAAAQSPAVGNPPLPQVGILPSGKVTVGGGGETVDVSLLGPSPAAPHFAVRAALPIPPDSENEGTASLTGLDPATMFHR